MRSQFSAYLDGALTGVEMSHLSSHLQGCKACAEDFNSLRALQQCLSSIGPALPPVELQSRLQQAIAAERTRESFLPLHRKALKMWQTSVAPAALRLSGGLAAALMLAGGLCWMFGAPIAVQANDDDMAQLVAPQYLYSQVPPDPIQTYRDVPVVVEAMVDSSGRVYDYSILEGPNTSELRARVEKNLLGSVFRPANVFGVPVRGHVVLTYTGISVRG